MPANIAEWLPAQLVTNRLTPLAITIAHAANIEHLPRASCGSFDRLLTAQACAENLTLVTGDRQFERYEVRLLAC